LDNKFSEIPLDHAHIQKHVKDLQASLEALHKTVTTAKAKRRAANRRQVLNSYSVKLQRAHELGVRVADLTVNDCIPKFMVGDFVLVAQPKKTTQPKLTATWRGPYRILRAVSTYVYEVEHLVSGATTQCHVSRMKFYADSSLDVPIPLLDELTHEESIFHEYNVERFLDHRYNSDLDSYELLVKWSGFTDYENTWESMTVLYEDIPKVLMHYVSTLPPNDPHKASMLALLP
jgi:hypothetical protein